MKVDQWEVCMNAAQEIVLSSSNGILHDQVDQWHNKGYFIVKNVNLPGEVNSLRDASRQAEDINDDRFFGEYDGRARKGYLTLVLQACKARKMQLLKKGL